MNENIRLWLVGALYVLSANAVAYGQTSRWDELTQAGHRAFDQQRLAEAERQFKAALKEAERSGQQDRRLTESLDNLGEAYRSQNKRKDAEKLFRQSLAIREKILGPWHLQVAQSLDAIADVLNGQKKYHEAEPLYQRAREIREKALARHPEMYVDGQAKTVREPH